MDKVYQEWGADSSGKHQKKNAPLWKIFQNGTYLKRKTVQYDDEYGGEYDGGCGSKYNSKYDSVIPDILWANSQAGAEFLKITAGKGRFLHLTGKRRIFPPFLKSGNTWSFYVHMPSERLC